MGEQAHELIDKALAEYKAETVWALFSGGHDSLVMSHVVSQHPAFGGVIFIDTLTGIQATRDYIHEVAAQFGWRLIVKSPVTTYEQLIVTNGFPRPIAA